MDKLKNKRKLRSGKEVDKDEEEEDVKESCGAPPTAKKVRGKDIAGGDKCVSGTSTLEEEPENTPRQNEDAGTAPHAGGDAGLTASEGRVCSLCSFVAKTPTALKVHAKRKHSEEGANSGKPELTRNTQHEDGPEKFETTPASDDVDSPPCVSETNVTDLIIESVKSVGKDEQMITSDVSQCEDASPYHSDSLTRGQQLNKINTAEGEEENIPTSECEESSVGDGTKPEKDIAGGAILLSEKGTLGLQASTMEVDRSVCQPSACSTSADGNDIHVKTRAKRSNRGPGQSSDTCTSPTKILLKMVEGESSCTVDLTGLGNSDGAGNRKQEVSDGLMTKESSCEAAECIATIAEGDTEGHILDATQRMQVEMKEAETIEEQEPSTCQEGVIQDPKPKEMRLRGRHSKEMKFVCEPCSYTCVAKSDFEKHCLSCKHKTRALEASTVGGSDKLEDTSKMAAQMPSDIVATVRLRPKTRRDRLRNYSQYAVSGASSGNEKTVSVGKQQEDKDVSPGELIWEGNEKSSGEDPLIDEDKQSTKESDSGVKRSARAHQVKVTVGRGSAEEAAERTSLKKRRGRPKGSSLTTCEYCGLVASNATNLSVHIRRRHSREYGFACKVCNYSCVTKGDMDRHCSTKKHIKRVQTVSDDQSQDCKVVSVSVVEVLHNKVLITGNPESAGGAVKSENQEVTSTMSTQERSPSFHQDESEAQDGTMPSSTGSQECTMHEPSCPPQKKGKYDAVNTCTHCGFVAHSLPSLELHVKRKHTRDFEYVCLACNYYAVTCREMSRHAATDKHRQKSKGYLGSTGSTETDVTHVNVNPEAGSHADPGHQDKTLPGTPDVLGSSSQEDHQAEMAGQSSPNGDIITLCVGEQAVNQSQENDAEASTEEVVVTLSDNPEEATVGQENILSEKYPEEPGLKSSEGQTVPVVDLTSPEDPESTSVPESADDLGGEVESEMEDDCGLEGSSDVEVADGTVDSPSASKMVRAIPFDASIIPFASMFEGVSLPAKKRLPPQRHTAPAVSWVKKNKAPASAAGAAKGGGSGRIRCEDCGFMADGLSGLNVHVSMKHPSKDKHFHCLLCGKSFYTESNLHQHLTSAAHLRNEQASIEELPEGGASFKCVKCSEPFVSEQQLFTHIKEKHEELLREVNKYVLEDTEQINKEREENQGCVCKYCGKVCKSSNSMAFLAHVRTHTGSKPFKCKLCDFATAQLGDARNHVKRHLGVREYKCPVCGWAFVMKKHLNTHMLGKHGVGQPKERKFECELCDRSFSEKWSLNNHMKLHTGAKPYKCTWPSCHYSFLTMSAMKDHYRTHTGEKSFLCDLCGFAGGTRHALTKHRRQHTGEKPFKCHLCSFASTTQSHLTRHRRVHTGEKPYHCPWCQYRSNCAENIRKHILHTGKHEGVKMYNCPKCEYGTNAPMDFRNHLKELHPDIENPDLAYLHAGIVSKSFECRLKGQGASFVKAESTFSTEEGSLDQAPQDSTEEPSVQQFIIIQGYGDEYTVDSALEESAAATLQTLAMGNQVAEVLHITEDGQVIGGGTADTHQLAAGAAQFVLVESEEVGPVLGRPEGASASAGQASESSSALDALLTAVTELGGASEAAKVQVEVRQEEGGAEGTYTQVVQEVVEQGKEVQKGAEVDGVVQEVLQFAASQLMMKEGLTQVIVNDEGTHYIVTELDGSSLQVEGAVYTQGEGSAGQECKQEADQALEGLVVYSETSGQDPVTEQ
ncbi:hypothetical protein GJAV_G00019270 [Gymnothorax javanicus]|nr:hypothetical protein GJAV_G00019270 [Gymnothorax javanicus]